MNPISLVELIRINPNPFQTVFSAFTQYSLPEVVEGNGELGCYKE